MYPISSGKRERNEVDFRLRMISVQLTVVRRLFLEYTHVECFVERALASTIQAGLTFDQWLFSATVR